MAKWLCRCGAEIRSSGELPNPQEWHAISDADLHELPEQTDFGGVLDHSRYVYRCDQCDRLHVFWNGLDEWPPTIYAPEEQ